MLLKRLAIPLVIGVAIVVVALIVILAGTKNNHLQLNTRVIKARTGALDENSSAAILDFRVTDDSDIPFMVGEVEAKLVKADGSEIEGQVISSADIKLLLQYNRFLGDQYNPVLIVRDRIAPHATLDRMVAVRFDVPQKQLEASRAIRLTLHDVDGPEFTTEYKLHS